MVILKGRLFRSMQPSNMVKHKKEFIALYFELHDKCNVVIDDQDLKNAISLCDEIPDGGSYKVLIQEYQVQHNLSVEM